MTVKAVSYPGCCTAKILLGFGQERNAGYDARVERIDSVEIIKEQVDKLVRGYMIGSHHGVVSACLTSRQTRGIQALTELGFHVSPAFKKTGHRESDLHTFYINPMEFIQNNPVPYVAPAAVRPAGAKRLVKNLNPHAKRDYNYFMRESRYYMTGSDSYNRFRARAKALLEVDANFA